MAEAQAILDKAWAFHGRLRVWEASGYRVTKRFRLSDFLEFRAEGRGQGLVDLDVVRFRV